MGTQSRPAEVECDLLVVGAGAGGLSAAVTAAGLGGKEPAEVARRAFTALTRVLG